MKLFPILTLVLPPSRIKNALLNFFPHAKISSSSYIGFSYIDAKELIVSDNVRVKHFVKIKGVTSVILKEDSYIGNFNTFYSNSNQGDDGKLILGSKSELVRQNSFDLTSDITIGNNVVVGGYGSQFWTHGFDVFRNRIQGKIVIGDNIYIGSHSIFNLGVSITDNIIIGAGSLVSSKIDEPGFYAGVPIQKKSSCFTLKESRNKRIMKEVNNIKYFVKD